MSPKKIKPKAAREFWLEVSADGEQIWAFKTYKEAREEAAFDNLGGRLREYSVVKVREVLK